MPGRDYVWVFCSCAVPPVGLGIVNQFAHLCTCPVFPDQLLSFIFMSSFTILHGWIAKGPLRSIGGFLLVALVAFVYEWGGVNYGLVSGGLGCLDRKQGFISEKLCSVNVHAAACFCG
jgi:hypothetical protein